MTTIDLIIKAIEHRKPIRFEYHGTKGIEGERIGNPYAVFFHPDTDNACVHIYQTDGVSHRGNLPGWRTNIIEHIINVSILDEQECFDIEEGYNPNSMNYMKVIKKV